jgi:hypothetical protein
MLQSLPVTRPSTLSFAGREGPYTCLGGIAGPSFSSAYFSAYLSRPSRPRSY